VLDATATVAQNTAMLWDALSDQRPSGTY